MREENDPNESLQRLLLEMTDPDKSDRVSDPFAGLSEEVKVELARKFFRTGEKLKSLTMNALLLRIVQLEAAIADLNRKDQASRSSSEVPIAPSFTNNNSKQE